MKDLDEAGWDRLIETNLTGSYNSVRRALERMRPRKKGLIILINSVAGRRSVPLAGIGYNASKFGMSGLGMGIAEEERENGIRITNLYPGEVNTPILEQRITPPSEEHKKRILQADDIAEVILQICELPDRVHIPELVIKPTGQPFSKLKLEVFSIEDTACSTFSLCPNALKRKILLPQDQSLILEYPQHGIHSKAYQKVPGG